MNLNEIARNLERKGISSEDIYFTLLELNDQMGNPFTTGEIRIIARV